MEKHGQLKQLLQERPLCWNENGNPLAESDLKAALVFNRSNMGMRRYFVALP